MCMGGCGGKSPSKGNSYTPKSKGGSGKASKGSYSPKSRPAVMSSFGKPSVRMSFSGRK